MALWQVGFFILPKDYKSQISNLKISDEFTFDDAPFWHENKTSPDYFEGIDKFLQKNKSWADYITLYGHENSNRFEVISENNIVESVSFRIDFTSDYEFVLNGIIEFCILNGLIILDENLNIVPLNLETAKSIIIHAPQVLKYNNLQSEK
ncbi:MAG: hypothetical protein RIR11_3246 [Bacteroidota bacterium]|jgi:hypothetical protein